MTTSAPTGLDEPPADAPRFLRAFWRLVRWALPEAFRYFGTYEYRIAKAFSGPIVNLQATSDTIAIGMTDNLKVPAWPGVAGVQIDATEGARVLVQFINGNAARPFVIAWAPSGDAGWLPANLTVDATGAITIGAGATAVNLGTGSAPFARTLDIYSLGTASGPLMFIMTGGTDPLETKVTG